MSTSDEFTPHPRIRWPAGYGPGSSRIFMQNTIEIDATPEKVWSLLVDCTKWPTWYKHCSDVSILRGGPVLGPDSKFRFKTFDNYFEPDVDIYEASRMVVWFSKGPFATSNAHAWYIEPTSSGCRVTTEETQFGLLLIFVAGSLRKQILDCHQDWLEGLKELAEKRETN